MARRPQPPAPVFPLKVPCTGCFKVFDAASMEDLEALVAKHKCYIGLIDPDAEKARYEEGYAKGFAAGFEAGRMASP